ncbi:MAG: ZIP family metal transporter [Gemmatimonadota bacterium]|jgi:ZIP family zinc transporter/zinc and cadmium transporter|nr:ZIP family metal transporter [Gemmatimonadota bacterium]
MIAPAILYALVAAVANVVGGLLITSASPRGIRVQRMLLGFGAGFMLAAAFASMLPHAIEIDPDAGMVALFGYLLVHVTQHILTPHFHFGEETHHEAMVARWVGTAALLGLLLHTFFDGVAIASAFDVNASLGLVVFLAVLVHKVPEGVTIASIMLVSGNSKRRALQGVVLLGATTVGGVLLTSWIQPLAQHGLALSAGVTTYVAASNLVPEVQKQKDFTSGAGVIAGVLVYLLARLVLGGLDV